MGITHRAIRSLKLKCILCLADFPSEQLTKEHVFPEAIGGRFCIRRLCKACNSHLGQKVDSSLTEHFLIVLERFILRLQGKGAVPNPFKTGTLSTTDGQKVDILADGLGDLTGIRFAPDIRRTPLADGSQRISISIDAADRDRLPEIVNRMRQRAGHPPVSSEEATSGSCESVTQNPEISVQKQIDLVQYRLGVLKIAYELATYWLGDDFLSDPTAENIRQVLVAASIDAEDHESRLRGRIAIIEGKPMVPIGTKPPMHIGALFPNADKIMCYVRVFGIFDALIPVSQEIRRYDKFRPKLLELDPQSGDFEESALTVAF